MRIVAPIQAWVSNEWSSFWSKKQYFYLPKTLSNRPGVARAVLQTALSLSKLWFVEIYSKQHYSQTITAGELKLGENVHPPTCVTFHVSHVTCHMSHVTCHVSRVTCHVSRVTSHIFFGQIGGASQWRACYQRSLPRLVLSELSSAFVEGGGQGQGQGQGRHSKNRIFLRGQNFSFEILSMKKCKNYT